MPHVRMCAARHELPQTLIDLRGIRYMLSVKLSHKLFRTTDLPIRENEFVVITGGNGAGKYYAYFSGRHKLLISMLSCKPKKRNRFGII
jgi:Fe-S cluster assembly ATPase SufC